MRTPDSSSPRPKPKTRRDGWTAERQLGFLAALARTRSVTRAARAVGMSRESAYRLRGRPDAALFALLWDRAVRPDAAGRLEGHSRPLGDGHLARLLGTDFRRKRGDFSSIGLLAAETART
jgi:hypothetical protein